MFLLTMAIFPSFLFLSSTTFNLPICLYVFFLSLSLFVLCLFFSHLFLFSHYLNSLFYSYQSHPQGTYFPSYSYFYTFFLISFPTSSFLHLSPFHMLILPFLLSFYPSTNTSSNSKLLPNVPNSHFFPRFKHILLLSLPFSLQNIHSFFINLCYHSYIPLSPPCSHLLFFSPSLSTLSLSLSK